MGMGKLGLASRYLFACCGSVLNYGWIASPNVPGQFSALELREIIDRHKTPRAKDRR
jgi:3-dehydroquinate dehydratase-1